jgi:hypothetical protein
MASYDKIHNLPLFLVTILSILHKTVRGAALLLALLGGTANASIITLNFEASVSNLDSHDYATGAYGTVTSSNALGQTISVGDTMRGQLSFNTNMVRSYQEEASANGTSTQFTGFIDFRLYFPASGTSVKNNDLDSDNYSILTVADNPDIYYGFDILSFTSSSFKSNTSAFFALTLIDTTGKAINGDFVPTHVDPSAFAYQYLNFSWYGMSETLNINASMSSVKASQDADASAVPEPGAIFLLMAGVGALVFALSRRAAAQK